MRIEIYTTRPDFLIQKIFEKAENRELKTWNIRKDNKGNIYLTHESQWKDAALLHFKNENGNVMIEIFWWNDQEPDDYTKGIYLGRFCEALLNHFNEYHTSFEIFH